MSHDEKQQSDGHRRLPNPFPGVYDRLLIELLVVGSERVHSQFKGSCIKVALYLFALKAIFGRDIVAKVANTSCKRELLVVVMRERYGFLTLVVIECDIRQIGDLPL